MQALLRHDLLRRRFVRFEGLQGVSLLGVSETEGLVLGGSRLHIDDKEFSHCLFKGVVGQFLGSEEQSFRLVVG